MAFEHTRAAWAARQKPRDDAARAMLAALKAITAVCEHEERDRYGRPVRFNPVAVNALRDLMQSYHAPDGGRDHYDQIAFVGRAAIAQAEAAGIKAARGVAAEDET